MWEAICMIIDLTRKLDNMENGQHCWDLMDKPLGNKQLDND
jgi:hypothetical protein